MTSDEKKGALIRVATTNSRRRRADEEYLEALEEAVAAGVTYPELGRLLGISRQAVRQYILKGRS